MKTQWNFDVNSQQTMMEVRKEFQKRKAVMRAISLHITEEERESFWTALCTRMARTNHDEKCSKRSTC